MGSSVRERRDKAAILGGLRSLRIQRHVRARRNSLYGSGRVRGRVTRVRPARSNRTGGQSPVDHELGSRGKARFITGQKDNQTTHLVRFTRSLERALRAVYRL